MGSLQPVLSSTINSICQRRCWCSAGGLHGKEALLPPATVSIVVAVVSFVATMISALNAAMRPSLQYGHYVRFINRFWTERITLEIEAEGAFLAANGNNEILLQKMNQVVKDR